MCAGLAHLLPSLHSVIRITCQAQPYGTVVIIDGWLVEADVAELRRIRESGVGRVVLKLGGLEACVPEGIGLLQDWLRDGALLETASPFMQMVLESREGSPAHGSSHRQDGVG